MNFLSFEEYGVTRPRFWGESSISWTRAGGERPMAGTTTTRRSEVPASGLTIVTATLSKDGED